MRLADGQTHRRDEASSLFLRFSERYQNCVIHNNFVVCIYGSKTRTERVVANLQFSTALFQLCSE